MAPKSAKFCEDWRYCARLRGEEEKDLFGQVEEKEGKKPSLYTPTKVVFIQVEVTVKLQW